MTRLFAMIFMAVVLTVSLSACGKKNAPKPPDEKSAYPQDYPKPR